jgi:hypothetical protein
MWQHGGVVYARRTVLAVIVTAVACSQSAEVEPPPPPEPEPIAAAPTDLPQEPAAPPPEDPPTTLPLTLLATLAADDPGEARATIRDNERGVIATYRAGDVIRDDAIVVAVERGKVRIEHDERRELLAIGIAPAKLSAEDVFYPDLVEHDLPNTMVDAVQLPEGAGYVIKRPHLAWGTPRTVHVLREALRTYAREVDGGPAIHVGDISRKEGGPLPPHLSHRHGLDVDIGYVLRGGDADTIRFTRAHAGNLDRARTWALLETLLESRAIGWIFMDYDVQRLLVEHARASGVADDKLAVWFQYPHGNRAMRGMIRDWRGHDDHFHVRFVP